MKNPIILSAALLFTGALNDYVMAQAAAPANAQASSVSIPKPVWTGLSARAQSQIVEVGKALATYGSSDPARSDGFVPILGWIPTMGTHWVNNPRMFKAGKSFKLTEPAQLMYSPVNGKETLVGAAYAYLTPLSDSTRPPSFDGNPPWHEHPDLAPDGMRLVMLHVWLVPSPDGAFAGHNPFLPYWANGITPPPIEWMKDPAVDTRVRKVALGLAMLADTTGLFPQLHRRPAVRAVEDARGDTIRSMLPELDAAARSQDVSRWSRVAERAAAQWDAVRAAYLASAVVPENRARIQRVMDEMTAGPHDPAGHHH